MFDYRSVSGEPHGPVYVAMENHHANNGKHHHIWQFSIAKLPEGIPLKEPGRRPTDHRPGRETNQASRCGRTSSEIGTIDHPNAELFRFKIDIHAALTCFQHVLLMFNLEY